MQVQRSEIPSLARASCKRCHGRGIEGVTLDGREIVCRCVKATIRRQVEQKVATGEVETVPLDRQQVILAKHAFIRERIGVLQQQIADAEKSIREHPLQQAIDKTATQAECNRLAWERREREAEAMTMDADGLAAHAHALSIYAENIRSQEANIRRMAAEKAKEASATLDMVKFERKRDTTEDELAILQKKLHTATHQIAKKARETEKTIQRLQAKLPDGGGNGKGDSHGQVG